MFGIFNPILIIVGVTFGRSLYLLTDLIELNMSVAKVLNKNATRVS